MRWVLLRGLTREAGHWREFSERLAGRTGDQVLLLDLPGNGRRFAQRTPWSVAAMAAEAIRLVPAGQPIAWLALSLGGMVALEACRLAPERMAGCALVNTSAGGLVPPWHRLQPSQYPTLLRLLLPGLTLEQREQRVLAMTSARPAAHPRAPDAWAALARSHPVLRANALRQLWAAARYRMPRQAPTVPTLLLASRGDRLVHPHCSTALAQHWGVPVRVHPWAGHDLPLDAPDWLLDELAAWRATVRA